MTLANPFPSLGYFVDCAAVKALLPSSSDAPSGECDGRERSTEQKVRKGGGGSREGKLPGRPTGAVLCTYTAVLIRERSLQEFPPTTSACARTKKGLGVVVVEEELDAEDG